jgi:hypothetical protein
MLLAGWRRGFEAMQIQAISSGTELNGTIGLARTGTGGASQTATSGSGSNTASETSYDVMDTNKDGYVSFMEWLMYVLTHPGSQGETGNAQASAAATGAAQTASPTSYNSQGVRSTNQTQQQIDLFA